MVIGNNDGTSAGQIFCGHQTSPAILYSTSTTAVKYSAGSGISYTVSAGYMATPRIYVVVFNGASSALYINTGTAVSTGNAGANNPSGAFFLGSDVSTSNFLNGKLMEVAIWSGTPSVVQIIQYGQSLLFSSVLMDSMDFRRKSNSRAQLVRPRDVRRIRPLTSGYVSSLSSAGLFR